MSKNVCTQNQHPDTGTGYVFERPQPESLLDAIRRGLRAYRDPARFHQIRVRAMDRDDSWDMPARAYLTLYESLRE